MGKIVSALIGWPMGSFIAYQFPGVSKETALATAIGGLGAIIVMLFITQGTPHDK